MRLLLYFFFNAPATTEIYTLSYTTLFRSSHPSNHRLFRRARRRAGGVWDGALCRAASGRVSGARPPGDRRGGPRARRRRSEEHTSELQSQSNLVCRLLLEKKNKKNNSTHK